MRPENELWWALTRVIQRYSIGEAIIQEDFAKASAKVKTYRFFASAAIAHA